MQPYIVGGYGIFRNKKWAKAQILLLPQAIFFRTEMGWNPFVEENSYLNVNLEEKVKRMNLPMEMKLFSDNNEYSHQ